MSEVGVLVSAEDFEERTRVILDYTSRDFAAIRSQLVGLAKGFMGEWKTVGEPGDFGTLLLELFAYMGDTMHFYIDRTASEAFLGTAIRRQSVLYIADQMGYTPIGQQAATVGLTFKLSEQAEFDITLPQGTSLHNNPDNSADLIVFELSIPVTLKPGGSTDDPPADPPDIYTRGLVYATEGITVDMTALGVSQGRPNTDFIITDKGIIHGSITVKSLEAGKTVTWTYTDDLALARPTQNVFTTYVDETDLTHIVFGDNASGRIPPVAADIFVSYRYGVGARANDLEPGSITTIVPPTGIDVWGIEVTNPESPLGGTDPESIESMRFNIPRAAGRIKHRAVTLNDYADLALQVPGVAKAVAHGAVYTAVYVRVAPIDGQGNDAYMDRLCVAVEAYMLDKTMIGSTVYAEPRKFFDLWRNIYIQVTVHVGEGFNRTTTRVNVDTAIRAALAFDLVDFGYAVTIGLIYRTALAVQGVEWVELTHLSDKPPPDQAGGADGGTQDPSVWGTGTWNYATSTDTTTDPGNKNMRANDNANPTELSFSKNSEENLPYDFDELQVGDHILIRQANNSQKWRSFVVPAAVADHGTWASVPVTMVDTGTEGQPDRGNSKTLVTAYRYEVQEEGNVTNLLPDPVAGTDLLIPRIETTEVIEEEVDYPDMDEDERTHDGLWVIAVGGLVNT